MTNEIEVYLLIKKYVYEGKSIKQLYKILRKSYSKSELNEILKKLTANKEFENE